MDVEKASEIILSATTHDYGNFYGGPQNHLSLGVGQIYNKIRYPMYDDEDSLYDTLEGMVYVLTHECDIDQKNERPFNKSAIICPILPLEHCLNSLNAQLVDDDLRSFLGYIGKDNVSRVTYFPAIKDYLPHGGLIDLNQLSSTHVDAFTLDGSVRINALTASGLRILDYKITNHLLRPKSEKVSLHRF